MAEQHEVVIVGAGPAGLSLSHELSAAGRSHVVLERGQVAQSWRGRWDSFCLVGPNLTVRLAGGPYAGADPDGFMPRDDFVAHLDHYAASFGAPVRGGVEVHALSADGRGGFTLQTSQGPIGAHEVVLATGGYQRLFRPAAIDQLPQAVMVLDVDSYTNPTIVPPGRVLVVGSGQTGCQIAEELVLAGRDVVMSCGRAPWQPRRFGDRDTFAWLVDLPFMKMTAADLPSPMARLAPNPQSSGKDGGHDLNYRTLQALGVVLAGHLVGFEAGRVRFAPDLAESVAYGDARYADICEVVRRMAVTWGVPVPDLPVPARFVADAPDSIELADLGAVIVTSGFRPDYIRWVRLAGAFDDLGLPIQVDGSSTVVPGLHFMGVPFQRNRASSNLMGVGADAVVLGARMTASR